MTTFIDHYTVAYVVLVILIGTIGAYLLTDGIDIDRPTTMRVGAALVTTSMLLIMEGM